MQLLRSPARLARLRPFVQALWASEPGPGRLATPGAREHVLPTGAMHLVFRLTGPPLRLFAGEQDLQGYSAGGHALVGGPRERFYIRDMSQPCASVGVLLRPGAALPLVGAPADALAGRHTSLDDLWGPRAGLALERLQEVAGLNARLDLFESLLLERLADSFHGLHPAVAQALDPLCMGTQRVRELATRSGYSHRRFIDLFRAATGLAPKAYERVHRLGRVLDLAAADAQRGWADIADEAGFADQSHLTREFGDIAGLSPQAWRRAADAAAPRHVPR
ncbi:MAG: AraC family transcriptional regulator [Proteobacteria bacterium]|nr:AraC family transcriptional regulator [Pseudomonadota bacterium]